MALTPEQKKRVLERQRERRWEKINAGICFDCGCKHESGHNRCEECHRVHLQHSKNAKERRRTNGEKCVRCSRPLVEGIGKSYCPCCMEKEAFDPTATNRRR